MIDATEGIGRTVEEDFASCNLAAASVCRIGSSQEQAMASPPPSPSCWPSSASVSTQTPSPKHALYFAYMPPSS